jgi:hypothetical protein
VFVGETKYGETKILNYRQASSEKHFCKYGYRINAALSNAASIRYSVNEIAGWRRARGAIWYGTIVTGSVMHE